MNSRSVPLILCIDDDEDTLKLLRYLLKHGDYEVMTAGDGRRGIQLAKATQPDMILLDVEMPGLNGYDVCMHLQKDPATAYIPVVFVTARKSDQDREKAFKAGAADFLTKPFHMNPLLDKVLLQLHRNVKWQQLKEPQSTAASPSSNFLQFKKSVARKLDLSPDGYARWLQISSLQMYDKAADFGIAHTELAQLIADFLHVPYVPHISSTSIRIGVMPSAFSKAHHIVAVDAAGCGLNFILSNPFNMATLDAMKKCMGAANALRFAVTEPANIAALFEHSLKEKTAVTKRAPQQAYETIAHGALSLEPADEIPPEAGCTPAILCSDTNPESAPDRGTLAAPVMESPAPAAPLLHTSRESSSAPTSILVVDDDAPTLLLLQHYLVAAGYQVTLAADGIDALVAIGQQHFDLIISDITMPNLDGYKLLEMLNLQGTHIPLIMVTGSTGPDCEIKSLDLGAEDYIAKPFNKDVLLFRVKKALSEHRSRLGTS